MHQRRRAILNSADAAETVAPEVRARSKVFRWSRSAATYPLLVSLVVTIGIWYLVAGNLLEFLPTTMEVAEEFWKAVSSSELYADMAVTLRRVVMAWIGAYILALILGIAMGRSWLIETIAHPWVFVGLALPGALVTLFCILVFGLEEITTLIALWLVVTPFIVTFIYDGTRALDRQLEEMADVYRLSMAQRIRHVVLPQLAPSLMAAGRFGFAMGWKLVVLVEALSSNVGIGERIHFFFTFNQPDAVIAWTLTFTVVMILMEIFFFQTLDRKLFAWRPKEAEALRSTA
jgi:NitT/TauT family transport system permease protein